MHCTTPTRTTHSSWKDTLAAPSPGAHILQVYDTQEFLASAVAHYAAAGLRRGEAVVLAGTHEHRHRVREALHGLDVDAAAATHRRQLFFADVHEMLAGATEQGELRPGRLAQSIGALLADANPEGRFAGVRWWGEHSDTLYYRGDAAAALELEAACNPLRVGDLVALCSFLYDRFDPQGYGGILNRMCCAHTHIIPADDYVTHRMAVNRAIAEVVGEIRGTLLQSLSTWKGLGCELPSSQALLFWLREALPDKFEEVLARARAYHACGAAGVPA
jgi:hypothetical protein